LPAGEIQSASFNGPTQIDNQDQTQKFSNPPTGRNFPSQPQIIYKSDDVVFSKENLIYIRWNQLERGSRLE
jgi:hypothetical protein